MKPTASFSTTSAAGILLTLVLTTGAARSFSCIGCGLTTSYHSAVRVYDTARAWSQIARWWIDPGYASAKRDPQAPANRDNVCELRPTSVRAR
jgi:hypothetical protein